MWKHNSERSIWKWIQIKAFVNLFPFVASVEVSFKMSSTVSALKIFILNIQLVIAMLVIYGMMSVT